MEPSRCEHHGKSTFVYELVETVIEKYWAMSGEVRVTCGRCNEPVTVTWGSGGTVKEPAPSTTSTL